MPMTWDADNKAKLFAAIMQVCNVKPTADQLQKVADIMGQGCTPKAITHQLTALRKAATSTGSGGAASATPSKKRAAPTEKAKAAASVPDDTGDDDDEEEAPASKKLKTSDDGEAATPIKEEDDEVGSGDMSVSSGSFYGHP